MRITPGELANTIIANCKEVEPGFGAIVDEFDYKNVIGRLIDQGKIAVKDIQDALKEDQQSDVDDEVEDESSEPLLGPLVEYENFRYRHWLSLDPPSEEFRQEVAEHDRRLATLEEFAQRNQ